MAYQTGRAISVAYGIETTFGTAAAGNLATAKTFRANSGGLNLTKQAYESGESRSDGMSTRGRHGQKNVQGQYIADLSHGTFDDLIEAVMRSTWVSALAVDETSASLGAVTISGGNTLTAAGGSWITAGFRVGMVVRLTSGFAAGNLNKNLRITALTATVMTVTGVTLTNEGPIAAWDITAGKHLLQGTTRRSWTIEEREADIDGSELFVGNRISSLQIEIAPNQNARVTFGIAGQDMSVKTGADSPYFTSLVAATTTLGMSCADCAILYNGTAIADLTGLTLSIDLNAAGTPVVGADVTPDVFENNAKVTGRISGLRQDFNKVSNFLAEDQLSLHLLLVENESEPQSYISVFVGNVTLGSASKSELGNDGPRTQNFDLLVGKDERGGAYAATMVLIQTDAA
jgi:hypothetical protein